MAVVTSGNETIVRYGRGLVAVYYSLVVVAGAMCLLLFAVAFNMTLDDRSWKEKVWSVGSWSIAGLSFALASIRLYSMGKAYAYSFVAVGPQGVRMQLPKSDGESLLAGQERRLKWDEIVGLTFEKHLGKRICRFTAGEFIYTLNQHNCPSPETVAKLLAEGKGIILSAPRAAV